jgi:two-component sensor histidine kinase
LTPRIVVIATGLMLARALSYALVSNREGMSLETTLRQDLAPTFAHIVLTLAPALFAVVVAGNLGPTRGWQRPAVIAVAIAFAVALGLSMRLALMRFEARGLPEGALTGFLLTVGPRSALLAGMLALALESHRRALATNDATQKVALDSEALEGELARSQMQALQAQIEPHFLFNTLANVRRLCDTDLDRGRAMLDSLMRYLEIALPRMRDSQLTLDGYTGLVEAYLRLHQIRMGQRLHFEIEIPSALRVHPVPPLMLLTLVENAVKHGIAPSRQGGTIRVEAHEEEGLLVLKVADTGVGLKAGSGSGNGLANIRARLAAQFGSRAQLMLARNDLDGVTATISLPLHNSDPSQ